MAVQVIKSKVCDICGSNEDVTTYRVGVVGRGRGVAPDLCGEHSKPLNEAMSAVPGHRPVGGLGKQPQVKTEAEVRRLRKRA